MQFIPVESPFYQFIIHSNWKKCLISNDVLNLLIKLITHVTHNFIVLGQTCNQFDDETNKLFN